MSEPLPAYRLKIERAKRHVNELAEMVSSFIARNPYELVAEDNLETGKRIVKVRVKECVPVDWAAIVGDAIHNCRAALDLIAVAVVKHCDPGRTSYNHVHFVIRETKEEFEAALARNIQGASPAARLIFEDLKPYKGGDEAFWRLHRLDILDKHKALIPVGSAFAGIGITMGGPGFNGAKFTTFWAPVDRKFPLQDGAHIATLDLKDPNKDETKFQIDIAFGDGQVLDGEPLIPALTQIIQFVEGVTNVIEKNILTN